MKGFFSSHFGDDEPVAGAAKGAKQRAIEQVIKYLFLYLRILLIFFFLQRTAKTFFANERTLLSWLNTATFLSLAGLTMINTQTTAGSYPFLFLFLFLFLFWNYFVFTLIKEQIVRSCTHDGNSILCNLCFVEIHATSLRT